MKKTIAVFCGSKVGKRAVFKKTAQDLAAFLAKKNCHLVFGGGQQGLMGILAQSAKKNNMEVTGVITKTLEKREFISPHIDHVFIENTLQERKKHMFDLAQAYVVLPGGGGTMDELFEIMTLKQIGDEKKAIFLLNIEHYYDALMTFLDQVFQEGFLHQNVKDYVQVCDDFKTFQKVFSQWFHQGECF